MYGFSESAQFFTSNSLENPKRTQNCFIHLYILHTIKTFPTLTCEGIDIGHSIIKSECHDFNDYVVYETEKNATCDILYYIVTFFPKPCP